MTVFTKEEVTKSCLEFFRGDELATKVWMNKYCLKNKEDQFVELSPRDRFKAIAAEIHRIDVKRGDLTYTEEDYYTVLVDQQICPGGSGLYGIANPYSITSLGNCFVIDGNEEDSYGSIMKVDQEIVQIAKRRGGVGTDMSHLRPKEAFVSNSAGTSSGVVSFCERHSNSSREVAQDGRRGALMLSLHVNHPDIAEFINMKLDTSKVTGANVSVRLTDKFMHAVEGDGYYLQQFPCELDINQLGIDMDGLEPNKLKKLMFNDEPVYVRKVKARSIWNLIISANWKSAEPGALFWDTIIKESVPDCYPKFKTKSTNPCGEIPLSPYDSCRLISVNLVKCIRNPFTIGAAFDNDLFVRLSHMVVHMMDNIIDLEIEKIQQIENKIKADKEDIDTKWTELDMWRKIKSNTIDGRRSGISIIGHGDMLAMLGMKYGSKESTAKLVEIHKVFATEVYTASIGLAKVRGAFPAFNAKLEMGNPFLLRLGVAGIPRRHIALLTIPPVGTMSIVMNNQTSGIESVFMPVYKRSRKVNPGDSSAKVDFVDEVGDSWEEFHVFHPYFKMWALINHPYKVLDEMTDQEVATLVAMSPYAGASAGEIDPIAKIELIGAVQKWIDHSISNTTNLPADTTEKMVSDLYLRAWKSGCKGITIYRDGSRTGVLNSIGGSNSKFEQRDAPKRLKDLKCDIFQPTINGEKYIVLVGLFDGKPFETMALKRGDIHLPAKLETGILRKQKSGVYNLLDSAGTLLIEDITSKFETPEWAFVMRLISTALRHGAAIQFVVEQLNKSEGSVVHISKVIARQLKKYIPEVDGGVSTCPNCGAEMHMEGGCKQCKECGYGACG